MVYYGFDKKETTLELSDFNKFKDSVMAINVNK